MKNLLVMLIDAGPEDGDVGIFRYDDRADCSEDFLKPGLGEIECAAEFRDLDPGRRAGEQVRERRLRLRCRQGFEALGAQWIPAPGARRERVDDGTPADCSGGGLVPDDEPVTLERCNGAIEEQLNDSRTARLDRFATANRYPRDHLGRAQVQAHRGPVGKAEV